MKLEDIAEIIDCEHKTAPIVDSSDYRSIRTTDILNGRLDIENANPVSMQTYNDWTKRAIPGYGDIILAREAPVGEVGFIRNGYKVCLGQRTVLLKVNKTIADPQYLLYFLCNPETKYELKSRSTGSVVQHLNVKDIRNFEIILPPLPEQRAIAGVLSSLDDKIDLLHRQNKTLEAMAETLFRQWFVEEADEGWEDGTLGDLVELHYGKALKEDIRSGTGFPVVGSNGIVGYHDEFLVKGPGIVIGRKGTLGEVLYLESNFSPIDTTYFVSSKNDSNGLFFEYFLLRTIDFFEMNSDSAVPGLNRQIALSTEIKIPPIDIFMKFNSECRDIFLKIKYNKAGIEKLNKIKNLLLPKLMIGEALVSL